MLKPSEVAPVNAFILAEIIDEIGFPAGVFNLVSGLGPVVGEALATHPDVDMVSFTGSTRAGKRVAELAAQIVKKVALELGGKSPFVILDDADFASAVADGVDAAYENSGRRATRSRACSCPGHGSRRSSRSRATPPSRTGRRSLRRGTRLGPLISAVQRDRVRGYIERGIEEGATS